MLTLRALTAESQQLIALDKAMQRAVVDRDPVAFASFLTDDYVLVDSKGGMHGKAEVVAEITAKELKVEFNESSDVSVRIHGDTAVVIAVLQQRGHDHEKSYDVPVRFTDTWIRKGGKWLCLSGHASRL